MIEKKLGQSYPAATTYTTVYTLPASKRAVLRNIVICNTTAAAIDVRVCAVPNGSSPSASNSIYYGFTLDPYLTISKMLWVVLDTTGDYISVYVSAQGVTFTLSGAEINV